MFNSLRFRLTLIFVGLAIGPLFLVAAVIARNSAASLEQQSLALQRQLSVGIGGELREFIGGWEDELVLLDEVLGLGTLDRAEQREILANILYSQRTCQEIALLDQDGQELIRMSRTSVFLDDDLQNRAGNEEFLHPATRRETYFGPVRFDETIREPLITVAVPLFDEYSGKVISVLAADLRFKPIWDLLAAVELPEEGDAYWHGYD